LLSDRHRGCRLRDPGALQLRDPADARRDLDRREPTVVVPAPLMSAIQELGAFVARETAAVADAPASPPPRAHAQRRAAGRLSLRDVTGYVERA
jgi:hypothetical protein